MMDQFLLVAPLSVKQDGQVYVSKNFQVREFACNDGSDQVLLCPQLVEVLQAIRTHFGRSVKVTSGYRTPSHNSAVGGSPKSQHLQGTAADIVISGVSPETVADFAETLLSGTGGIGTYSSFTHVDVRKTKSRWNG